MNSPIDGGEVETFAIPGLFAEPPSINETPAARYAVPRDAAELPADLTKKWASNGGAPKSADARDRYLSDYLAGLDHRALDGSLAIDAEAAGALFGLSERAWRRLDVTGQIPRPIKIGRNVRWRLNDLAAWAGRGCPDREAWEAMK